MLVEDSFNNSTDLSSTNRQKFVNQYPKRIRFFFTKKTRLPQKVLMDTKKTQFQKTFRKVLQKSRSFFPEYPKLKKSTFSKNVRLTMFLWTQRKLFRPPFWKFFYRIRQFFAQCPQVIKLFFSKPVVSTKCFFGHVESSFDKAFGIFSTKCRKIFAQWPTMIRNDIFSSGNNFPHSVPMEM